MSRWTAYLGFAQRAGKVVSGETAVLHSLKRRSAKLVLVAKDAAAHTQKRVMARAARANIPVVYAGTREALGYAIGKSPRALVAVEDKRFADVIHASLREEN